MKSYLIFFSIFLFNCSSSEYYQKEQIDRRFFQAFQYVYKSEDAKKLWTQYESPSTDSLPILVNDRIASTQLISFRKEILENQFCSHQITKAELDSIYLALSDYQEYLFNQNSYGPIETLSNVDKNEFQKKEFLVLVFSKPFKNLLEV